MEKGARPNDMHVITIISDKVIKTKRVETEKENNEAQKREDSKKNSYDC